MSRQQSRKLRRARLKRGDALLKSGMADTPVQADLEAVATLLDETYVTAAAPLRASVAAARAHEVMEAALAERTAIRPLACKSGCSTCCHTWVSASAAEVFRVAEAVRSRPDADVTIARVQARAAVTAGKSPAERFGAKLPCPLLDEAGACGVYAARPFACRQATSYDLAPCLDEFEGRDYGGEMVVSRRHLDQARNGFIALAAALVARGHDVQRYEFSAALMRALELGDGEARWLAGEDVFAGVAVAPPEPAANVTLIAQVAAAVRGGDGGD